ncbi:phenylalanine--tRNA ligase subunit beta [Patescibacteria group bacterium]|nr:phenylalanine--tRNA ligase subunit beta [Patescibacteria group bacterium]
MNISLNWLKQFVELPDKISPKELALKLTMSTVEVEEVRNLAERFNNVVVGKIEKIEAHPNADKLKVVSVSLGKNNSQVVCGGTNLKENMLVAVALPGAKVRWHGEGELVTLEKTTLRGVESEGMICASDELGLEQSFPAEAGQIMDLTGTNLKVGENLAKEFGFDDVVIEIDNKSLTNRPDLWSHYGMAREISAIYDLKLKDYAIEEFKSSKEIDLKVRVDESALCPRYLGIAITGIKVGPSSDRLKKRLEAIGQKSINNVVDITNYILFELGQPLHSFDRNKILNDEIIVRTAVGGEKIITLDGEERLLSEGDLVIADQEKIVALAGIMGNENSEIDESTQSIIIESANFDPVIIRKTAGRLGIRSEAAVRFEKSLDPTMAELAIRRTVNLIKEEIPGAEVVSDLVDVKNFELNEDPIEVSWDFIEKRIGQKIANKKIIKILENLGFKIKDSKTGIKVSVPSWRATKDINIAEDIIEEITRIFGYDNLKPAMPAVPLSYPEQNNLRNLERRVKEILSLAVGANEVYTPSFVGEELLEKISQPTNNIEMENPWAENQNLLRRDLMANLLKNIYENSRFFEEINIFEVGKVFSPEKEGERARPDSESRLPLQDLLAGGAAISENGENQFFIVKGIAQTLFDSLGMAIEFESTTNAPAPCHPNQVLQILLNRENVGYVASVHPKALNNLEIKKPVGIWQINLNKIVDNYPQTKKYSPIAKFPSIVLDLSIVVNDSVQWKDIQNLVKAVDPKLIRAVNLFDVYKGDKIKEEYKSLTFTIIYQSKDRTLEMEEVNKLQKKIIEQLKKGMDAEIRM